MKESQKYLINLLNKNDTVVIALSGGVDSMVLLDLLIKLKEQLNLKIICAHVNHGLRKESNDEKEFVQEYVLNHNLEFEYYKIENYENNKFTEGEARRKRYAFFHKVMLKYHAKYLFTAHHGNDLEETILMRITRGSNLKGYAGIPIISKNQYYQIVRPLLYVNKKEIIKYALDNNIKHVEDNSNQDEKYTRNRFRKQVLPFLEQEDANIRLKFLKYSEELFKYLDYINKIIDMKIKDIYINNKLDLDKLNQEDSFIKEKIIERIIENIQKDNILNINDKQKIEILKLIDNKSNKQIDLADGYIARISYNYLIIEKNTNSEEFKYVFDKIFQKDNYQIEEISSSNEKSNNIIRLNSAEIELPLIIRNVRKGDVMSIKNLGGSKKVRDIFTNSKVDKVKRKAFPIICDSKNTLIWLPGVKKSIFDKDISQKYDIILKYTEEKYE